jgi:hypothetical protein
LVFDVLVDEIGTLLPVHFTRLADGDGEDGFSVGDVSLAVRDPYPSHLRPVLVHRRQAGFSSSHFFLRILGRRQRQSCIPPTRHL